jgi:alpha-galactosidase
LYDNESVLHPRFSRRNLLTMSAGIPIAAAAQTGRSTDGYVEILRPPDSATAFVETETVPLSRDGVRWTSSGILVRTEPDRSSLPVHIEAPSVALSRVRLRWRTAVPERWRILGEQWERSYGDLEWRGMVGERVLPWYFLAFDGQATHGYGVATGCCSFVFWQVDPDGISLWLDVRNGGGAVQLGQRVLTAATVIMHRGTRGENAFESARHFCRALCTSPRLPAAPVYGGNNWYYAYGRNCSAADVERDAALMAELAPAGGNRPFMVIDDGWSETNTAGPWDRGNERFPEMSALATAIIKQGVRPGIWLRPLCTTAPVPESARLRPRAGSRQTVIDPSIPEMLEVVRRDIRRLVSWGFEMVKHDYTSFDLVGRWGSAMGAELTTIGWHFADRSRTTAEITSTLYRAIREAAGDALIIGCNTFGHLAAGFVELQRTGDDTSGRDFNRTRRMGVNTLAFRAAQHRAFFDVDADCAPITPDLPWDLASRWLDLVARSGTALFVSPDPRAVNGEAKGAIRRAFLVASSRQPIAEPLDWMDTPTPARWRIQGKIAEYDWYGPDGGTPFPR